MNTQTLFSIVLVLLCSSVAKAAIPLGDGVDDGIISLIYDPKDGHLWLDAAGKQFTALEIMSAGKYFKGTKPPQVTGVFDVFTSGKLFILKPSPNQFGDQDFGPALVPGLSCDVLWADLTLTGALFPPGGLGSVEVMCVPEPSSLALFGVCLLGLALRRK